MFYISLNLMENNGILCLASTQLYAGIVCGLALLILPDIVDAIMRDGKSDSALLASQAYVLVGVLLMTRSWRL